LAALPLDPSNDMVWRFRRDFGTASSDLVEAIASCPGGQTSSARHGTAAIVI